MRPTFLGFETAKKAIFINQKSIDIMGNNLANIDTNGYTRQRVDRTSVAPNSASSRIGSSRIGQLGQGVDALGVSQTRDSFLDKRFRSEYAKASYHGESASVLDSIQGALGDGQDITDESGLYGAITQIYESLNAFSQEPTMSTQANLVMSAFKNMTQVLQQLDSNLNKVAQQQTQDLTLKVDRVNELAKQIAHMNKIISGDTTVTLNPENEYYRPNELLDQRNLLLDELSAYGDISVTDLADGKVNVTFGGHPIVTGDLADGINLTVHDDKLVSLKWRSTGNDVSSGTGTLISNVHYLNGRGNNVQNSIEEPYQGVPYYRDQLDTFANAFANLANNTLPHLGADGKPDTTFKTLIGGKTSTGTNSKAPITAANISISQEWTEAGADYFIFDPNQNVEDYALKLAASLTETSHTFDSYGEKFVGTFADFHVNMLGKTATDLKFHEGREESFAKVADDFLDRRDEISGVSQDEETADMLKFQKSYQAASRLMTVLDELLDVVVNRMGRAGL